MPIPEGFELESAPLAARGLIPEGFELEIPVASQPVQADFATQGQIKKPAAAGLSDSVSLFPAGISSNPTTQAIQNTAASPRMPATTSIVQAEQQSPDLVTAFTAPVRDLGAAAGGYMAEVPAQPEIIPSQPGNAITRSIGRMGWKTMAVPFSVASAGLSAVDAAGNIIKSAVGAPLTGQDEGLKSTLSDAAHTMNMYAEGKNPITPNGEYLGSDISLSPEWQKDHPVAATAVSAVESLAPFAAQMVMSRGSNTQFGAIAGLEQLDKGQREYKKNNPDASALESFNAAAPGSLAKGGLFAAMGPTTSGVESYVTKPAEGILTRAAGITHSAKTLLAKTVADSAYMLDQSAVEGNINKDFGVSPEFNATDILKPENSVPLIAQAFLFSLVHQTPAFKGAFKAADAKDYETMLAAYTAARGSKAGTPEYEADANVLNKLLETTGGLQKATVEKAIGEFRKITADNVIKETDKTEPVQITAPEKLISKDRPVKANPAEPTDKENSPVQPEAPTPTETAPAVTGHQTEQSVNTEDIAVKTPEKDVPVTKAETDPKIVQLETFIKIASEDPTLSVAVKKAQEQLDKLKADTPPPSLPTIPSTEAATTAGDASSPATNPVAATAIEKVRNAIAERQGTTTDQLPPVAVVPETAKLPDYNDLLRKKANLESSMFRPNGDVQPTATLKMADNYAKVTQQIALIEHKQDMPDFQNKVRPAGDIASLMNVPKGEVVPNGEKRRGQEVLNNEGAGTPAPEFAKTADFSEMPRWDKPVTEIKQGDEARLTPKEAQLLVDKSGDGYIYRVTSAKFFDSGKDSGNPEYGQGFQGIKDPIKGITSFGVNDTDRLVEIKLNNETPEEQNSMVLYRVKPENISGELVTIKREGGIIHLYSDTPVDTSKAEVVKRGDELVNHYDALRKKEEGITHEVHLEDSELDAILAELTGHPTEADIPEVVKGETKPAVETSAETSTDQNRQPPVEAGKERDTPTVEKGSNETESDKSAFDEGRDAADSGFIEKKADTGAVDSVPSENGSDVSTDVKIKTIRRAPPVKELNPAKDDILVAIALNGGINIENAAYQWGNSVKDAANDRRPNSEKPYSEIFGNPIFRKTGGMNVDAMAERLAEDGYLTRDANGKHDLSELEEKIHDSLAGTKFYSHYNENAGEDAYNAEVTRLAEQYKEQAIEDLQRRLEEENGDTTGTGSTTSEISKGDSDSDLEEGDSTQNRDYTGQSGQVTEYNPYDDPFSTDDEKAAYLDAVGDHNSGYDQLSLLEPNQQTFDFREGASNEEKQLAVRLAAEASARIGDLRRHTGTVLANAISVALRTKGVFNFTGQKITSAGDLAAIAQVYRNPSFETLRYYFTKDGVIVGHTLPLKCVANV